MTSVVWFGVALTAAPLLLTLGTRQGTSRAVPGKSDDLLGDLVR
ncbi:hypothetical protein [Spongiactinospora sp. TRM90649]|nr:hypothetical protein [Spongiactinospora sp. TRM90649]MDF5751016.1 hypothetical protein [Spongiactinospora sp. TRM90649]